MHQGWPKFVQNLWYATADNGLAALVYGPSSVTARVADGTEVHFTEKTSYPFSERIEFIFDAETSTEFPLHLRIPGWCKDASARLNGKSLALSHEKQVAIIRRVWDPGDRLELNLPMEIEVTRWFENSAGIIPVTSRAPNNEGIEQEDIILIPYGCTTLRIAEFPVLLHRD